MSAPDEPSPPCPWNEFNDNIDFRYSADSERCFQYQTGSDPYLRVILKLFHPSSLDYKACHEPLTLVYLDVKINSWNV